MLYINVYLVSQLYGGPEEGGWYYDAGEPLASVPINSCRLPGTDYYLHNGEVHMRQCFPCQGTGLITDDDPNHPEGGPVSCQDCGLVPAEPEVVKKALVDYRKMFEDLPGRYEHIDVYLQDHFAQPFPERKPHYE
jgi:hypothetical protein